MLNEESTLEPKIIQECVWDRWVDCVVMYRSTLYAGNIADGYFLQARSATTTFETDYASRPSRLMQTVDRDGPSECL
jgi:hypothetical protein